MRKLVLLLAFMAPLAKAQAPGSAVQTLDLASVASVADLDGPWRFHAGDDPRFADPNFDDSGWPSIRPNQDFQTVGIPVITDRYLWARIHLRVPTDAGRLALAVTPWNSVYEVFANGSPIASSPGMAEREARATYPFPVALPPSKDIVVAIRFYSHCDCAPDVRHSLPFLRVRVGFLPAIQTATELEHLRFFTGSELDGYVCLGITLLVGVTAMLLFRAQRHHDEYLWLGIWALVISLFIIMADGLWSGWLPFHWATLLLRDYSGWLSNIAQVEFFVRFSGIRRRLPIRILQGAQLIPPLFYFVANQNYALFAGVMVLFLSAVAIAVCLVSAWLSGKPDSRLLFIPAVVGAALDFLWIAALSFPTVFRWGAKYYFGSFGIAGNYLGLILYCLGIGALILFRFMRVSREEERAAAELEAARTVQHILVPEEIPAIPGFSIQAVYQPAGEVGGDFYQVLPTPDGSLLAIIGDVSGKGMPAAMTVSLLVGTVRTLAHFTQDPAAILTAMNQRMIGRGTGFTTCLVLRLDPDGVLTAANAGHVAPYANGKELSIDNGLPLGIIAAAAYTNSTLHLESGITLTLLTDGVVEAQNAKGELFGFDRTRACSTQPAETIAAAAQAFGQEDDITVLTLGFALAEVSRA